MQDYYVYPAIFSYDEEQDIAVIFPDLDTATCGVDEEDAIKSAQELLGITIWGLEEDGENIPKPTPLNEVKTEDNERTTLISVYMPSIRNRQNTKAVNRTVTLPAWLNSLALEHKINFSQLLQKAIQEELKL